MTCPRRLAVLLAAVLAIAGPAACGTAAQTGRVVRADTEGSYLDIGGLKYQVEASRQLNPSDIKDKVLLRGIAPGQRGLGPEEVWFGVFLRVQNEQDEALAPSADITITDTQDRVYEPIALDDTNVYRYSSKDPIGARELLPKQDSPAADTPAQGALVLFKLTNQSLDNRPLELTIEGRRVPQQTGIVSLDV